MYRQTMLFHAHLGARNFSNLETDEVQWGDLIDLFCIIHPGWDEMKPTTSNNLPTAEIQISYDHNRCVSIQYGLPGDFHTSLIPM